MILYLATITVVAVSVFAFTVSEQQPESVTTYTEFKCPDLGGRSMVTYQEERVCLLVVNDIKATFDQARNLCYGVLGDLITVVKNKQQKDFVQSLLTKGNFYWIGIHDPDQSGDFKYIDGTELGRWDAFRRGEPNNLNNNEHCVEMKNGKWYDKNCDMPRNFVCQTSFKHARG